MEELKYININQGSPWLCPHVTTCPGLYPHRPSGGSSKGSLRLRGESRLSSPASRVAHSRSGAREPPQPRACSGTSKSRGRSPLWQSQSPILLTPATDASIVEQFRQLERHLDEAVKELKDKVKQTRESLH
jgi:hypothetical protein